MRIYTTLTEHGFNDKEKHGKADPQTTRNEMKKTKHISGLNMFSGHMSSESWHAGYFFGYALTYLRKTHTALSLKMPSFGSM